jgi:glycosyltransferase involved in cell wall biosynthesis
VARIFFALREQIEAELWLVGDGEEMDLTKNTLQSLGLENDVHYWGLCRDVSSILRQADLLVMPSRSESFCLAALEAMACGVPVLASDVGGLPEVVIHNRTGFLFPSDDYAAAVHYAVRLLKDPVLYQSMSAAAVRQARRFDQEQIVSLYENLYYGLGAQEQH